MGTKFSYRALAMFMAFLMFSSSVGLSMDIHFCGNELKSYSFFGEAQACEMMQQKEEKETHVCCESPKKEIKTCHNSEVASGKCCHNETFLLDNGGDFESTDFSVEQLQQILVAIIVFAPNFDIFETSNKVSNYSLYNPPPITRDISILPQVFRI